MTFGSPSASSRAPPLLLFVIDTSIKKEVLFFSVLSKLLYYYFHVDRRLTWSWTLFNDVISPQKIPTEFNSTSLKQFKLDLDGVKTLQTEYHHITDALTRALLDLKWEWNSVTARKDGAVLSPPQLEKQKNNLDYKIRNNVFLITDLNQMQVASLKECLLESRGKIPLLRTALIEKRTALSIIHVQKNGYLMTNAPIVQNILRLTGGALISIHDLVFNFSIVPSSMIYGMFRGKIGVRRFAKNEILPYKMIDTGKKLATVDNIDIYALPTSLIDMYKNSISYSEKDLDFIGSLQSIRKLEPINPINLDSTWIDSTLSPFLVSREQMRADDAASVIECEFKSGSCRLAIISNLCFDGCVMVFLKEGMSLPLPSGVHEKFNLEAFDLNDWLRRTEVNGLDSIFREHNELDKIDVDVMARETFNFWKPTYTYKEPNQSLENIFSEKESTPMIDFKTIDQTLQYMSRSYADFLYNRYVIFI